MDDLLILRAGRESAPARQRAALGAWLAVAAPVGSLVLRTCLRVELVGQQAELAPIVAEARARGAAVLRGEAVVRHLVRVAVGLDSEVVGEDQVLHQLRSAVASSRARHGLTPMVGHLADAALRAGRQARSWLPADRPSLADVALEAVGARAGTEGVALVVGAGAMGALAARALRARGWGIILANRTPERAVALAKEVGGTVVRLHRDPSPTGLGGVVVAVSAPLLMSPSWTSRLVADVPWLIDLSAPPAVEASLAGRLGSRYRSIDDVLVPSAAARQELPARLEELAETTSAAIIEWAAAADQRTVASALAQQAERRRAAEIDSLWERLPDLTPEQRGLIEAASRRVVARVLHVPLERLGEPGQGHHERAARELFDL